MYWSLHKGGLRVIFLILRGLLRKIAGRRGIGVSAPFNSNQRLRLKASQPEPVCDNRPRIEDQRPRFNEVRFNQNRPIWSSGPDYNAWRGILHLITAINARSNGPRFLQPYRYLDMISSVDSGIHGSHATRFNDPRARRCPRSRGGDACRRAAIWRPSAPNPRLTSANHLVRDRERAETALTGGDVVKKSVRGEVRIRGGDQLWWAIPLCPVANTPRRGHDHLRRNAVKLPSLVPRPRRRCNRGSTPAAKSPPSPHTSLAFSSLPRRWSGVSVWWFGEAPGRVGLICSGVRSPGRIRRDPRQLNSVGAAANTRGWGLARRPHQQWIMAHAQARDRAGSTGQQSRGGPSCREEKQRERGGCHPSARPGRARPRASGSLMRWARVSATVCACDEYWAGGVLLGRAVQRDSWAEGNRKGPRRGSLSFCFSIFCFCSHFKFGFWISSTS
jgi:hypothetical protein